ncbi:MAG: SH3 domain-containing protein [bacterium]|nr:SH3 domain-containing protein [bacterium]
MKSRSVILLSALVMLLIAGIALVARPAVLTVHAQATAFPTLPGVIVATNTPGTPTIPPTFTVRPDATQPGCTTPLSLVPGSVVIITGGLNVRSSPSLSAPLVTYFAEETRARLTGTSQCANGLIWWPIARWGGEPGANQGWVIQGSRDGALYIEPAFIAPTDPCYFPLELGAGDTAVALANTRLRNAPTLSAYTVSVVPLDATLRILEGPACQNGINWWRVSTAFQTSGVPVEGWVAEGYPGEYYIYAADELTGVIEIPCVLPLTLDAGSRINVNYRDGVPRRLRAAPNVNAAITLFMPDEIALEIIGGPECSNGYNWWQVQVLTTGFTGWIAEGRPGRYNIEIIYP